MPANPSYGANTFAAGVTPQILNFINATFDKIFSNAMFQTTAQSDPYITKKTSTGKYIDLAAVMQVPRIAPWKGPKAAKQLSLTVAPVPMAPQQASVEIDKYDMMGDAVGIWGDAIRNLGAQSNLWSDWEVQRVLQSGYQPDYNSFVANTAFDLGEEGTLWGDGLDLFASGASGHTWKATNIAAQGNVINGALYDPLTWGTAVQTMESFVGNENQPLRVVPKGIIYSPKDEFAIQTALKAQLAAFDQRPTITAQNKIPQVSLSNVISMFGLQLHRLDTLVNNPGVAYLIGEVNGVGPFHQYMLENFHLVPSIAPTDPSVFYEHKFIYSVEGYGRLVAPNWFTVIRVADPAIAANA